jgi:hypothetical protein
MPKATTILNTGLRLGAVGVGALGLAVLAYVHVIQRKADAAEAAFWSLDGPPCPTLDKAAYEQAPGKAKTTAFEGVSFEYRVGHMMCTLRPRKGLLGGDYPVCQFTSPVFLGVRTAQSQAYFALPSVQAARVAILDGQTRCVLAHRFRMNDHR